MTAERGSRIDELFGGRPRRARGLACGEEESRTARSSPGVSHAWPIDELPANASRTPPSRVASRLLVMRTKMKRIDQ
jgi:hypothetical protein